MLQYDKFKLTREETQVDIEQTLVIIKPDAVERGLIGEIISRFENKDYKIADLKIMQFSKELAGKHYIEHASKPFFGELVDFITSGPVAVFVAQGPNVIESTRNLIGATDPVKAAPGSIRGDYGNYVCTNLVHASDSSESAKREIALFFGN